MKFVWKGPRPRIVIEGVGPVERDVPFEVTDEELTTRLLESMFVSVVDERPSPRKAGKKED